jgi:hypothetical protein
MARPNGWSAAVSLAEEAMKSFSFWFIVICTSLHWFVLFTVIMWWCEDAAPIRPLLKAVGQEWANPATRQFLCSRVVVAAVGSAVIMWISNQFTNWLAKCNRD